MTNCVADLELNTEIIEKVNMEAADAVKNVMDVDLAQKNYWKKLSSCMIKTFINLRTTEHFMR